MHAEVLMLYLNCRVWAIHLSGITKLTSWSMNLHTTMLMESVAYCATGRIVVNKLFCAICRLHML